MYPVLESSRDWWQISNLVYYSAAPELQEEEFAKPVGIDPQYILSVSLDEEREAAKRRAEASPIRDDDVARKAAARQFYLEAVKSRRSKWQVILDNTGNPVLWGNAILATVLSAGVGFEAYQKYVEGRLSWETVGLGAGILGLTAGMDYVISRWVV